MKTILVLLSMMGMVMMAPGAETASTNSAPKKAELSAARDAAPSGPAAAPERMDEQAMQQIGERVALSGALTKAPPSKARTLGELVNPFAPVKPQPESRWLLRTAWGTAATTAVPRSTPVETRHEPAFGLSLALR